LRFIRIGDRIDTQTNHHASYIVDSIHIVDPTDTSLLALNTTPTLTLVTCYPFDYVGSAPKRFVVQARLVF
jgi:sortase A